MRGDGDERRPWRTCRATPSERIGTAAPRNRRQPMCMPPSKRITISATTAIRSTVDDRRSRRRGSGRGPDAAAAATRNSAARRDRDPLGRARGRRSRATSPTATTRTISPKSAISSTAAESTAAAGARDAGRLHFPYWPLTTAHARVPILRPRCASRLLLLALLALAAPRRRRRPRASAGDGTLSVDDGRGRSSVDGARRLIGRLDRARSRSAT